MTAEMRDLINQLMGSNRAEEEGRKLIPYNHPSVCRAFLLGCCPHEILADTRLESFVACNKVGLIFLYQFNYYFRYSNLCTGNANFF